MSNDSRSKGSKKGSKKDSKENKKMVLFVAIVGALAGLIFGVDVGVISGALPLLAQDMNLNHHSQEIVVSSALLGAVIGALASNPLSRWLGRKTTIILSAIVFSLGAILCATAPNFNLLVVYRIFLGLALGMASFTAPVYLSEIAPKKSRGAVISAYQFLITIGILIAFISDTLLEPTGSWRMMLGVTAIPALIMLFCVCFLPKSPRWLLLKGKTEQAMRILKKIAGEKEAKLEAIEIQDSLKVKQSGFAMLGVKKFWPVLILGILLQLFQQFSGINAIMYYAPTIFKMAGYASSSSQMWATVLVGLVNVISTIFTIIYVDKFGRRPILFLGLGIVIVSLLVVFGMYNMGVKTHAEQIILVISVLTFIVGFAISLGPIVWMLCSEIFPLKGREFGIMITTAVNWIGNMIVGGSFLSVVDSIGIAHTFLGLAIINIIALIVIFKYVPETKGVSLEHIEKNLFDGARLRRLGK